MRRASTPESRVSPLNTSGHQTTARSDEAGGHPPLPCGAVHDQPSHRCTGLGLRCRAATLWVAVAAAILPSVASLGEGPGLPNIVIVYADDQGYGDFSLQNPDSKIPTPHLDRLAREGLRFTDAHSSSGVCTPSRYALLTGRYHWRQGEGIVNAWGQPWWDEGRLTMAHMLRQKGYRTACIGKWHLGWDWRAIRRPEAEDVNAPDAHDWSKPVPGGPLDRGFDTYFGDDVPNFPPYTWIEDDRILIPPTVPLRVDPLPGEGSPECRPGPMAEGWRLDAVMPRITEKAVAWIGEQSAEQPFFLYWSWTSPHTPIVPVEEFQGLTGAGPYGDFMHQSDAHLGQVLQALEDHGFAEKTLVIFSSDNGPEHYAYARIGRFDHDSRGPLRGLKRDVWEGGHRVPFVIRWPGVVEPGRVSDALISQIDLMATIAAIVDFELPAHSAEDSHNLLPMIRGVTQASPRTTHVHRTWGQPWGIRDGDWLYIDAPTGALQREPDELGYDPTPHETVLNHLGDDPGQRKNLAADQPQKAGELRALLQEIRQRGHSAPRLQTDAHPPGEAR